MPQIGHRTVVWLTGPSGAGKSTIAVAIERRLRAVGRPCARLDGDDLRRGLCSDLSYDRDGRAENARRASETAALIAEAGVICVVALISPYATDRASARSVIAKRGVAFLEVFVDAPLGVCEARDPKGLYRLARTGVLPHFTGISSPYQAPQTPDIHVKTSELDLEECVSTILSALIEVDEQGDAVVLGRFLRVEK